jgi:hypothetical protein
VLVIFVKTDINMFKLWNPVAGLIFVSRFTYYFSNYYSTKKHESLVLESKKLFVEEVEKNKSEINEAKQKDESKLN